MMKDTNIDSRRPMYVFVAASIILFLLAVVMDRFSDDYILAVASFMGINIILAVSLNITNGYTGLFSLGHPAFMAIGGYTTALLTFPLAKKPLFMPDMPEWLISVHLPFFPSLLIGGLLAALISALLGASVLRLKGHYLAVATMGFLIIVQVLINNASSITRGPLGLNGLTEYTNIYWVVGWVLVVIYVAWKIKFSSLGRSMFAIRADETAARSLGINIFKTQNMSLVVGAFFAGVAGGLWAHLVTAVTPSSFSLIMSFYIVVMVVVGGTGSIIGAIVTAILFSMTNEVFRPLEENYGIYGVGEILTSVILILILIYRPSGIFGSSEPSLIMGKEKQKPTEKE